MTRKMMVLEIITQIALLLPFAYHAFLSIFRFSSKEMDNVKESILELVQTGIMEYLAWRFWNREHQLFLVFTVLFLYYQAFKAYSKYVQGTVNVYRILKDRTYIITGSNTGIGYEIAKALLSMEARVVLACRSVSRANEAKTKLLKETKTPESRVIVIPLDLCDLESVRNFVKEFQALKLPLHGLVNNAGLISEKRVITKDGFETTFQANHLGHFLLTNLLVPSLEKTEGKVVNLSSCLHKLATHFQFDDLTYEQGYEGFKVYANSKLANILFTKGLSDRVDRHRLPIRCYAVHPGCVRTEFTRGLPWWMQLGNMIVAPILASVQKTPAQGAYGILEVLLNSEIDKKEKNGTYFFHGMKAPLTPVATDYKVVDKLWELSEKMTGYTWNQKSKSQ